jgi:hypothetical protein
MDERPRTAAEVERALSRQLAKNDRWYPRIERLSSFYIGLHSYSDLPVAAAMAGLMATSLAVGSMLLWMVAAVIALCWGLSALLGLPVANAIRAEMRAWQGYSLEQRREREVEVESHVLAPTELGYCLATPPRLVRRLRVGALRWEESLVLNYQSPAAVAESARWLSEDATAREAIVAGEYTPQPYNAIDGVGERASLIDEMVDRHNRSLRRDRSQQLLPTATEEEVA